MAWWVLVAILVATTVLTALLQPKSKPPKPSALGDFQAPTAEEGRVVSVIFGTVKVAGPNVIWYGDFHAYPIKARSGIFSKTTTGYRYYMTMQLALCHGVIDSGFSITAGQAPDDIAVPHTVISTTTDLITLRMTAPGLFGGDDRAAGSEGGLEGEVRIYRGTATQGSDPYLNSVMGFSSPEYRGLCHAVLGECYLGTSNYLKNINFVLGRFPSNLGLAAGVTRIVNDANPVEIIYEAMTNATWGLGLLSSRFDLPIWRAAATTLASEGMGMSLQLDTDREAGDLIADVLRHIDAAIQTDPETGLWTIKLIRADYDPDDPDLLELSEEDQTEPPEFNRGSWDETWNEIKINYLNGATFKPGVVQAQDPANVSIVGMVKSQTLDFLGFSRAALAQTVAMRELKAYSYPFGKVRLHAKRKAWPLRVGSPFKLSWAPAGITSMICRVLAIDYGRLESGVIEIDAIEDEFAIAYSAFDPPEDSAWVDPIADPEPPAAQILEEAPLEWLATAAAEERVLVGAVRADYSSAGYDIWADEGAGFFNSNKADKFCPSGTLTAGYLRTTSALDAAGFTIENARDLADLLGTDAAGRARGDCLLIIEEEFCAFQGITDNEDATWTFTNIVRGAYDTFPADHAEGTRVFIARDAGTWYLFPYRADQANDIDAGGDQFIVVED